MKQEILEKLYRQYYASALLYALSLCGQRETAEDLVADAFVKAYVSLDESHPAFSYWLMRVIKNLWLDQLRKQKRHPDLEPEPVETPEQLVVLDERRRTLWNAINRFSPADRELLTLLYFSGLAIPQVAQLLHRTPGAVKTKLCRLRQNLKLELEEQGYAF